MISAICRAIEKPTKLDYLVSMNFLPFFTFSFFSLCHFSHGTSFRHIPDKYHQAVRTAINSGKTESCSALKLDDDWIKESCKDRVIYNNGDQKICNKWKSDNMKFAHCLGIIANRNQKKKICEILENKNLSGRCLLTFKYYSTIPTDSLEKEISTARKSKGREKK